MSIAASASSIATQSTADTAVSDLTSAIDALKEALKANDLASAKLLIPVDPDMPMLGGRTLRVNAGVELAYHDGKPLVMLAGHAVGVNICYEDAYGDEVIRALPEALAETERLCGSVSVASTQHAVNCSA